MDKITYTIEPEVAISIWKRIRPTFNPNFLRMDPDEAWIIDLATAGTGLPYLTRQASEYNLQSIHCALMNWLPK